MLSQKLRNYFHHVVKLQTDIVHIPKNRNTVQSIKFNSHKELIQYLKKDSLYTGLYQKHIAIAQSLMEFDWNSELAVTHSKISVFDEWKYLERKETVTIQKMIKEKLDRWPKPILTDEQKVLSLIDYCKKMNELSLTNEDYKEYTQQLQKAHKNWKNRNFENPRVY